MATVVLFLGKEYKPELDGVSGTCNVAGAVPVVSGREGWQ